MEEISNERSYDKDMEPKKNIYELILHKNGTPPLEGHCVSAPQDHLLRIILRAGSELCIQNPTLMTNYPVDFNTQFEREKFTAVKR